jgi:hypothetical protein
MVPLHQPKLVYSTSSGVTRQITLHAIGMVPRRSVRVARPERFELPTLWFEDKSTIRRKILRLNVCSDNKAFSPQSRMSAAVSGCVRLIVGSLQKSLQCIGPIFVQ